MSQIGNVIGASPLPYGNDWLLLYSYNLDGGGTQQAEVVVGNTNPPVAYPPYPPTVAFWASAASTISISSAPGTTNLPILIPCPVVIKAAAFGLPMN